MTVTLDVTKRTAGDGRLADTIPGVVYGPKQESVPLAIDARVMAKTLEEAGESTIITLKGLDKEVEVLIHDVAFNAEKGGIEHVDFYAIEVGKELTTHVAIEFINEAPAEKTGATVNKILHDVEVTCKPNDLPAHFEVDLSVLVDENSQIHVSDIKLPTGVKIENDPEDVVANVAAAREEEPEEAVEAVDMDAIEVESKGKEDTAEGGEEAK